MFPVLQIFFSPSFPLKLKLANNAKKGKGRLWIGFKYFDHLNGSTSHINISLKIISCFTNVLFSQGKPVPNWN